MKPCTAGSPRMPRAAATLIELRPEARAGSSRANIGGGKRLILGRGFHAGSLRAHVAATYRCTITACLQDSQTAVPEIIMEDR